MLDDSIYLDPPVTLKEGYLIKEGYNKELDELKTIRKGGKDYITHPLEVANIIKKLNKPIEYQITALFHDLLEDTEATEEKTKETETEE